MHRYRSFHGARGIDSYQVWNEANISTFWTGSMRQMALLSQDDVRRTQPGDPGAQVIAPPMVTRLGYQQDWLQQYYRISA